MNDIYRSATEVIVFLGDGPNHRITGCSQHKDPGSQVVFYNNSSDDALQSKFLSVWQPPGRGRQSARAFDVICLLSLLARPRISSQPFEFLEGIPENLLRKLFESLRRMICSPWWDRIWVVQEIIVGSTVTVQYGNVSAPWSMLSDVALAHSQDGTSDGTGNAGMLSSEHRKVLDLLVRRVADIDHRRQTWRENKRPPLLSLVREFSSRKASDDRDKIFALLGLCHSNTTCRPVYSSSVKMVYQSFAVDAIRTSKSLSVLSGDLGRKNRQDLPSWVPDWSATFDEHERHRADLFDKYDACGGFSCSTIIESYGSWKSDDFHGRDVSQHVLEDHVCDQMSLLADSLKDVTNPARLLPKYYAPALDTYKKTRGDRVNKLCDLLASFCHPAGARTIETLAYYSLGWNYRQYDWLVLKGKSIDTVENVLEPLYPSPDLATTLDTVRAWAEAAKVGESEDELTSREVEFAATLVSGIKTTANGFERLEDQDKRILLEWYRQRILKLPPLSPKEGFKPPTPETLDSFTRMMKISASGRAFFITTEGRMGLGPASMRRGDGLYLLPGGRLPMILREQRRPPGFRKTLRSKRKFSLIGDCYLHGAMDGSLSKPEFRPHNEGSLPEEILRDARLEALKIPILKDSDDNMQMKWRTAAEAMNDLDLLTSITII